MPVVVYATVDRDPSFLNAHPHLRKKMDVVNDEGRLLYDAYCQEVRKLEHGADPEARNAALKAVHNFYDVDYKLALEEAYTAHSQGVFKPLPIPSKKYCLRFPLIKVTGPDLQAKNTSPLCFWV